VATVDVTVSIINHESRDAVLACLAALDRDAARQATLQTIVVDNASQDGSTAAIRAAFSNLELIERTERHGFGANHNVALARARGRHVLLLNADAHPEPGAIDALAAYLDAHTAVGIVGPRIVHPDGMQQPSAWPLPTTLGLVADALSLGHRDTAESTGPAPHRVGWLLGAAVMARRSALLGVGGFDEGFFMYQEDVDLGRRLTDAGHEAHYVPAAGVVHEGQGATRELAEERAVEMARSRVRYLQRHHGAAGAALARTAIGAQFAIYAASGRLRGRPARSHWLQARGSLLPARQPGLRERADEWNRAHAAAK
jgi:GT2 family glycosyltransferase